MRRKVSVSAIQKTAQFAQVSKPLSHKPVQCKAASLIKISRIILFFIVIFWVICDMHNADIVKVLLIQKV